MPYAKPAVAELSKYDPSSFTSISVRHSPDGSWCFFRARHCASSVSMRWHRIGSVAGRSRSSMNSGITIVTHELPLAHRARAKLCPPSSNVQPWNHSPVCVSNRYLICSKNCLFASSTYWGRFSTLPIFARGKTVIISVSSHSWSLFGVRYVICCMPPYSVLSRSCIAHSAQLSSHGK